MYIFLDVDGVLNTKNDWKIPYTLNKKNIEYFCNYAKKVDGKVVLISSWRTGFSLFGKNAPYIEELINCFNEYDVQIVGRTVQSISRDAEILDYIQKHNVSEYIIIDDDVSLYHNLYSHLYLVDANYGFQKSDIKAIRRSGL